MFILRVLAVIAISLPFIGEAHSATVTAVGDVTALSSIDELVGVQGFTDFDGNSDSGIMFHSGVSLESLLAGIDVTVPSPPTLGGDALSIVTSRTLVGTDGLPKPSFPGPLSGGAEASGNYLLHGVATFNVEITQLGFTAGKEDAMFLTVFAADGTLIGQVNWLTGCSANPDCLEPVGFIGIDTGDVPIALAIWGNDDLYSGETFQVGGTTPSSDNWIWASGKPLCNDRDVPPIADGIPPECTPPGVVPLPASLPLLVVGLASLGWFARRRK